MTSNEAIGVFQSGKSLWVIHSKPRVLVTAIEKVTDSLVRITVNGETGLHCAAHLQTEPEPRPQRTDSNRVNRKFFNGLMKALR
jgi:hypothetical protein